MTVNSRKIQFVLSFVTVMVVILAVPLRARAQAPAKPWKGRFFDNDFSAKGQPGQPYFMGEELKENQTELFGQPFQWSVGGELRNRSMHEMDRLRPGGPGKSKYQLWRWRHYFDLQAGRAFRFYVETIDASIFGADLPILPIDKNRWDVLNAFVDVHLGEYIDDLGTLRFGRQELLFGKQRLVSPLDWGNTRRNFQGFQYLHSGETWNVNAFAVNPVNTAAGNGPLSRFDNGGDRPDGSVTFSGVYANWHGRENLGIDFYWLWLDDGEAMLGRADGRRHTVGMHWASKHAVRNQCCEITRTWDFDMEGGYQFGNDNGQRVHAGFLTGILGHTWNQLPWKPRVSELVYWGSGDDDPNDGETNTFNVLFPLSHAYWGLIDNLSGQNLLDYSLQLNLQPTKKLGLVAALHWFNLANQNDVLYNIAGVPVGTPNTGTNIGQELDVIANYNFNPNFSMQAGYSWFWYGNYVDNNAPRDTATQFYLQTTLRY
jgi:hypothetical protein